MIAAGGEKGIEKEEGTPRDRSLCRRRAGGGLQKRRQGKGGMERGLTA